MMNNFWVTINQLGRVMPVIGLFVGLVAAIIVFFWFMHKNNQGRFTGLPGWLFEFLHFKNYIVEVILKFTYVVAACACTGIGIFSILSLQLPMGLGFLLIGNLSIRIVYELLLLMIATFKNVNKINKKLGDMDTNKADVFEFKKPPMPRIEDFMAATKADGTENTELFSEGEQKEAKEEIHHIPKLEQKCCSNCENQLREDDLYCSQCGKKVEKIMKSKQ